MKMDWETAPHTHGLYLTADIIGRREDCEGRDATWMNDSMVDI